MKFAPISDTGLLDFHINQRRYVEKLQDESVFYDDRYKNVSI